MDIKYMRDDKLKYRKVVLDGLVSYSQAIVGILKSEIANVYVFEGDKLVGGCQTELEWNWVYIEGIYYENQEILNALMNELYNLYRGSVEGIMYESHILDRIEEFKLAGFDVLGTYEDKPLGFESFKMINNVMEKNRANHGYSIAVLKEKHDEYDKIIEQGVKKYNEKHDIDDGKAEIEYISFDGEKVVGGVYGYIQHDYLYVSLLWVDEVYRKSSIATKLMKLIEDEAKGMAIKYAYLGTCTFQAKGFYEKIGYEVKMIVENCPKGYEDFAMIKKL